MIADAIMRAGMVPSSYEVKLGSPEDQQKGTKAKLMIGVMKGLEVGFGPITALSTICIINNRPCVWGDGAIALCDRGGAVEWVKHEFIGEEGTDTWACVYRIKRKGHEEPYEGRFSVKEATRAKLWNNPQRTPWIQYPQRMLLARARAFALREGFADFLMGLSIVEEMRDLPAEPPAQTDLAFLADEPHIEVHPADETQPPPANEGLPA